MVLLLIINAVQYQPFNNNKLTFYPELDTYG